MKKFFVWLLTVIMLVSVASCGRTREESEASDGPGSPQNPAAIIPNREYDKNDPKAVLEEITNDFADVINTLVKKQEETFTNVGTTYEEYQINKGLVDEWLEMVFSESDALFERTRNNSVAYF